MNLFSVQIVIIMGNGDDDKSAEPLLIAAHKTNGGIIQPNSSKDHLLEDAAAHRDKALAYVKPRLTWWKPRYRKAADELCDAARLHYQAREFELAIEDFILALQYYEKKRRWFSAAKTLEQVVALKLRVAIKDDNGKFPSKEVSE